MNALYAIVFSACWFISSVQCVDPTMFGSSSTADLPSETIPTTDGLSTGNSVYSRQTTSGTASQLTIFSTLAYSTTPEKEPVTSNNPSGRTSTDVPLAASGTASQPNTYGTASQSTTSGTTSQPTTSSTAAYSTTPTKEPVTPKSGTTSTHVPLTTATLPNEKSLASLTKTSILLIVIPALYYLHF